MMEHEPQQEEPLLDPEHSASPCPLIIEEPESPIVGTPPSAASKRVTFDRLHVQEYPVILGDHPATSSGLPVTLDWTVANSYQLEVNQYESVATRRRSGLELRMPPEVRRELLHGTCTDQSPLLPDDMRRVAKDLRKAKDQRRHTIAMQDFETLHILFESAARKWKRWRDRWQEDSIQEPAAIWLKEWQMEKKLQPNSSSHRRNSTSSCGSSILKNSNTQASTCKATDVDSSESTRTTTATAFTDCITDQNSELLTRNNSCDLLTTGDDARVILNVVDLGQSQSSGEG